MKILQVISSFPPAYAYGGPAKVAYELSKELVKIGHDVTVYTTDVYNSKSRGKYDTNPIWLDGIEIYHFKNLSNTLAHNNFPFAPFIAKALNDRLEDFDIIHLHEYRSFQSLILHYFATKKRVPYVLQAHGSVPRIMRMEKLKSLYDTIRGYDIINDASKIFALTNTEAKSYVEMGANINKIEIVQNGLKLSDYINLPTRGKFRKKYSIGLDDKVILSLSRLHKIKGIELLVDAFAGLSKELGKIKLVIVGPDEGLLPLLKAKARKLNVEQDIIFTGPIYEQDDKLSAYVDADVYVLASIYETFPMTILEACACGIPIITTDRCGIADIIDNNVGYVVEYDKDQLRDSIYQILSNKEASKEFSKCGPNLVMNKFEFTVVTRRIETIYQQIINNRS